MAQLSAEIRTIVRDQMSRAARRIDGAAVAIGREDIADGEFDNHFDGVVSAIFHVADAVELTRTGIRRKVGEGDEATVIRSVLATLTVDGVGSVPGPARLIDLNYRRNASVHGDWTEILDRDALADAILAGRQFHRGAAVYIERRGVTLGYGPVPVDGCLSQSPTSRPRRWPGSRRRSDRASSGPCP